jgi:hypothetical protein
MACERVMPTVEDGKESAVFILETTTSDRGGVNGSCENSC